MLSKELLEILCCPKCHAGLMYDDGKQTLTCTKCKHVFEIREGIPIMIIEEDASRASGHE
jgi:hypothetical protein